MSSARALASGARRASKVGSATERSPLDSSRHCAGQGFRARVWEREWAWEWERVWTGGAGKVQPCMGAGADKGCRQGTKDVDRLRQIGGRTALRASMHYNTLLKVHAPRLRGRVSSACTASAPQLYDSLPLPYLGQLRHVRQRAVDALSQVGREAVYGIAHQHHAAGGGWGGGGGGHYGGEVAQVLRRGEDAAAACSRCVQLRVTEQRGNLQLGEGLLRSTKWGGVA